MSKYSRNKTIFFLLICALLLAIFPITSANASESNKTYHWSFNPKENNEPATTEPIFENMLEKHGGVYIGDKSKKDIYLTFDNGYENGKTSEVLDVLKEKGVPAAFFVTGHYIKTEQELTKRMVAEGHIVGNHSFHHPSLPDVSDERLEKEIKELEKLYTEVTGEKNMRYLRAPRGTFSERTLSRTHDLGYTNVFWSFAYKDWEINNQKGWKHAYDNIMKRVHPGAILLLHSVSTDNAEALPQVIDDLRKQGYNFKSLDDLMLDKELLPMT